jgi:ATP-binding cassette subfamily C (CFTR/MRP) protein 4
MGVELEPEAPPRSNEKGDAKEAGRAVIPTSKSEEDTISASSKPHPLTSASIISRLLFLWPYALLKLGMQRPLEDADLPCTLEHDSSVMNKDRLTKIWEAEKRRRPNKPDLRWALFKDFLRSTWFVHPMMFCNMTAKVVQALALGRLVESMEDETDNSGFTWATIICVCALVVLFEHHHSFFFTWRHGMRLRISAVAMIYDKALRLSSTHQEISASNGRIMNLASNDVERYLMACLFINFCFWAPVQSIAILIIGYQILGAAFAAGFALLIFVFVPLQYYLAGRFAFFRSKVAGITDKRVTFVSQAVRGARVMKMSGYEERFLERIQEHRKAEVAQIMKANRLKVANEAMFYATNVVLSAFIFLVHVLLGNTFTPGDVFTVFTLINILQLEMTKHVSLGVMFASEASVSTQRIQKFLEYPELAQPKSRIHVSESTVLSESKEESLAGKTENRVIMSFKEVTSYWNDVAMVDISGQEKDVSDLVVALDKVSLDLKKGELLAVIGTVGSGKSALLQAIVGELSARTGSIERGYNSLAYAAQDPWMMDGTIKENILMGMKVDLQFYNEVVEACGLSEDFLQIQHGDQAIVGDRGVQLSGGQRARVGLARALYCNADILVADDPLSAVDARVGRQIFNEAILGVAIKRGKSVILATHQLQYLSEARCLLMVNGQIACNGSYEACMEASNGKLLAHSADDAVDELHSGTVPVKKEEQITEEKKNDDTKENEKARDDNKEVTSKGIVQTDTYREYLKALGGPAVGIAMLVLFCVTQGCALYTIATLGRWAERPAEEQDDPTIMLLVGGLASWVLMLSVFRAYLSFELTLKASRRLHDRMAKAVLRAKISFFDTNPLGRVLNRFSADIGIIDDALPVTLFDFLVIAIVVLGSLFTTVTTLPYTLAAVPPLAWYFMSVRRTFVTSTRELKRLEGLARSPIFAMMSEALSGVATIRANNSVGYFKDKFQEAHNAHTRTFFSFISSSRWVGFRMDSIVVMFLIVVVYLAVWAQQEDWFSVDPAILGLSISMIIYLAGIFQWCIRMSAEVVNHMVSVERVLEFGKLEPEAALEEPGDAAVLSGNWPQDGAIEYNNLMVRYRPNLPPALKDISFKIPAGARVGVVGRTGSGKSTIVQTLFRLLEAERGSIFIDGLDVSKLGLHTLRTHISVIPQVPTLFSGCTVRENLDLFHLHSDDEITHVLKACHLWEAIQDLSAGWDSMVAEGGSNFSVGQRQLLCLARAILASNKILILDEATASVDRRTDELLQQALQVAFKDGTILAVAHRLDTVIEFDYILVLGHGNVLEFGSPADLLRNEDGHLARMVQDTGETMSEELRQRAFRKDVKKRVEMEL